VEIAPTALQFRAVRPSDDYYPSEAMTLGEEGIAIVKVCVGPTGRIDGKPTIDKSAGSPRLDRAAVAWAREALRFTPATENGVAVAACKGFRVNFTLH
jgi:TonB family protein